jgi:hypothetical protein
MKVQNMTSSRGNKVANQFIITTDNGRGRTFQSYDTVIAKIQECSGGRVVVLDENSWDCSVTTRRYRNIFLGENKAETIAKIDSGEYLLADLNN